MDGFDIVLSVLNWMAKNPGKALTIIIVLAIIGHFMM